jgi:hypothetical protein
MRIRGFCSMVTLVVALASSPHLYAQAQSAPSTTKSAATAKQPFDPHDLTGTWRGDDPKPGIRNFASYDQKIPEPPLTDWGKQHLLFKAISHDALGGKHLPGWDRPGHLCPNNQDPCFSEDPNGVPANDFTGEYPGKDCEPLSTPGTYDVGALGAMEFLTTPDGTRIFQMLEYHREWRTFWLNRDHPKNLDPTYEGDSIAHWEGDTLVVDTIGYNGKTDITQNVGHLKSDAFRLVERFRRTDHDHLELDMTYYDPKAWGDKSWPGFKRYFKLVPTTDFEEFICSPREYQTYDKVVTEPEEKALPAK